MILSNFFDSFYENVKSLPPLALFSDDRNNNSISNSCFELTLTVAAIILNY